MLIELLSMSNYVHFNVKLAEILGLHTAIYLGQITDINEKIDTKLTKVYVDGKEVEYKYDSKENTLSFNVENGNHSVGVSLVDTAGNAYDIPEIRNLYVGNTRLYVGMGIAFIGAVTLLTFIRAKKRKGKRENK